MQGGTYSTQLSASGLDRDEFGIPILPADKVELNANGTLSATVHVFTDITPSAEKYVEITLQNISTDRVLPPFTYNKPDTHGKDPRDPVNISYIDEKTIGKVREGYVLLGLLPSADSGIQQAWGMRNHLHKPVTTTNPGLVCAVYDGESDTWSTRNYFEAENVNFEDNGNALEVIKNAIN